MKVTRKGTEAIKPLAPQGGNVLCLDVGFSNTGAVVYKTKSGIFIFAEVITTEKGEGLVMQDDVVRCTILSRRLRQLVKIFKPVMVIAELPTGAAKGARAHRAMGLATGVVVGVFNVKDFQFFPLLPSDTKRLYRETGAVTKEDMQVLVRRNFPETENIFPKRKADLEHVADAAACIIFANKFLRPFIELKGT